MRKTGILLAMLFLLAGCAGKPLTAAPAGTPETGETREEWVFETLRESDEAVRGFLEQGMSAVYRGETEIEVNGKMISVYAADYGTMHEEQFVAEYHYAVDRDGKVYQMDYKSGDWFEAGKG